MNVVEISSISEFRGVIKEQKGWYILKLNGYTLKIYGLWLQVYTTPEGYRGSGVCGHKTQKALIAEVEKITKGKQI